MTEPLTDPLAETHHELKDLWYKYEKERSFDTDKVRAILGSSVTMYPVVVQDPMPSDQIDVRLAAAVSSIARLQGMQPDDQSTAILVECAKAKLSVMADQMSLSLKRRQEKRPTAFKSALQHVLHLNRIQDPMELQTFYHQNVISSVRAVMNSWQEVLDGNLPNFLKKGRKGEEDEQSEAVVNAEEDGSGNEQPFDEEEEFFNEKRPKRKLETIDLTEDVDDTAADPAPMKKRALENEEKEATGVDKKENGVVLHDAVKQDPVETVAKVEAPKDSKNKKTPRQRKSKLVEPKTEVMDGDAENKAESDTALPETTNRGAKGRKKANDSKDAVATPQRRGRSSKK